MSHVTGNEPEDHRADLDWLYRQDKPASGYAGGGPQTLLLPPPTTPASPPAPRRPVIIMIVLLLCLTAGAVAGMVLLLQPQSPRHGRISASPVLPRSLMRPRRDAGGR